MSKLTSANLECLAKSWSVKQRMKVTTLFFNKYLIYI